jgi:hypothetical protein
MRQRPHVSIAPYFRIPISWKFSTGDLSRHPAVIKMNEQTPLSFLRSRNMAHRFALGHMENFSLMHNQTG